MTEIFVPIFITAFSYLLFNYIRIQSQKRLSKDQELKSHFQIKEAKDVNFLVQTFVSFLHAVLLTLICGLYIFVIGLQKGASYENSLLQNSITAFSIGYFIWDTKIGIE